MKVQAEVSIYPLRVKSLSQPIDEFCQVLKNKGLKIETGSMGSFIVGESELVFEALRDAFEKLAGRYDVVMDVKISNACPGRHLKFGKKVYGKTINRKRAGTNK